MAHDARVVGYDLDGTLALPGYDGFALWAINRDWPWIGHSWAHIRANPILVVPDATIITARPESESPLTVAWLRWHGYRPARVVHVGFYGSAADIAFRKAKAICEFGLTVYYDDDAEVIDWLRTFVPYVEVIDARSLVQRRP